MGRVLKESLLLQGARSVLLGGWQQWWWVAEGAARATKWEKGALSDAPRLLLLFLGEPYLSEQHGIYPGIPWRGQGRG